MNRNKAKTYMFLIGQYDSPFVRRVAIAMRLYGIAFEHRPWSTFGDADKIAPYNPLRRTAQRGLPVCGALLERRHNLGYLAGPLGPGKALLRPPPPPRRRGLGAL